jgi:hypothetical protein
LITQFYWPSAKNFFLQIPALSGFWILTALLHLPAQLFLGINPEIFPLPMERYTILVDTILSTVEVIHRLDQR